MPITKIVVNLQDEDQPFVIIALVQQALYQGHVAPEQVQRFFEEATKDDYDHLMQTVEQWVTVRRAKK